MRGRGRGRGRGGGRGRGRGRGRGGSRGRGGRGGSRGGRGGRSQAWDESNAATAAAPEVLDIETDVKAFFLGKATFDQHLAAQEDNKLRYASGMAVIDGSGVDMPQNSRVRSLAAAWARKDHKLANAFMSNRSAFGLVEVLKALNMLDASRSIRVHEKKLKRLQLSGAKISPMKMGKFKSDIDNLSAVKPSRGSASGAVCKHIRRWVRHFTKDELEYFALFYPSDPWKKLADLCHFNSKKDFPNLEWFLPYCFGEPAPEGTMVRHCKDLSGDTVNDLLKEFDLPYSHVKQFKDQLTEESKAKIAATDKLDIVLWYYEDLRCDLVDEILQRRLTAGEEVTLTNGKLLERLLTIKMLRENIPQRRSYCYGGQQQERNTNPTTAMFYDLLLPIAQNRIEGMSLPVESPVVVIGDRSGSMEVAIRTSTIIAALLSALGKAKLVFFNNENLDAPKIPENIEDILEQAVTISATGGTTPAASLYPFYERKEKISTFIMVTDEEENGSCHGDRFDALFEKYYNEVHPAKLVFVSFLRSQHAGGNMTPNLVARGIQPIQFKLDQSRPDLDKLDTLFGLMSAETASFPEMVESMEKEIEKEGIQSVFEKLSSKSHKEPQDMKS